MPKTLSIFGCVIAGVIFFIVGLIPGVLFISSPLPGAESYILIGLARFSVFLTGICEFLLGIAIGALWITVRRNLRKSL